WDYKPARALWLQRLDDPAPPPRALILAIRGLGTVREGQAAGKLRTLVLAGLRKGADGPGVRQPGGGAGRPGSVLPMVRLEAARALGSVREGGLEGDAEALAADPSGRSLTGRLAAASLLRRHRGETAVRLLQRLARDPEPAVAVLAGTRLLEIDHRLL